MSKRPPKDPRTTNLLRRLRGQVFRASRLLDEPDDQWRRRKLLDGLLPGGERIGPGEILCLTIRVPYREPLENSPLVFPGWRGPVRADLAAMARLAGDDALSRTTAGRLAVIDTETTGLLDNRETVAFLVGIGRFGVKSFALEQYFLEDYESEPALLDILERRMQDFRAILSYNGAAFDMPLLRRRFGAHKMAARSWEIPHWDVLPSARRLWSRRGRKRSLVGLECDVFAFERRRDVESDRIPAIYHDYLGGRRAERLAAVFDHNAQDILTTAAVAVTLARAFRNPKDLLRRELAEPTEMDRFVECYG